MKRKIVSYSFITLLVVTLALLSSMGTVLASSEYLAPINNNYGGTKNALGTTYNCGVCHTTPNPNTSGSSSRNPFGAAWRTAGSVTPIPAALAVLDSDGDGSNNGAEFAAGTYPGTADADTTPPTVTINQASGQADPTGTSPINFTVVFNESVTGFISSDVTVAGTAGGTKTVVVTGGPSTYNVAVSGMTTGGTVIASIAAGVAQDAGGNSNAVSTSTDNTVTFNTDTTAPTVTINQAGGQADPTSSSPINFTVVFSESVTGFATGDVTISGTAGGTKTATVSGSGTTYNVAVTGMTSAGTVIASIAAGVAQDAGGNSNAVSTSTDNTVTYNATPATGPDMTIWIGKWIKMSIQNRGYYHEDEHRLSNDRQSFPAYLKITAWDPDNNVLQATLIGRDSDEEGDSNEERKSWSVPVSLHYISGTNLNFLCWSQITYGSNSYGFTARVTGVMKGGVLVNGVLTTVGGYHAQSDGETEGLSNNQHSGGWLRITGRMIAEEKVPGDLTEIVE